MVSIVVTKVTNNNNLATWPGFFLALTYYVPFSLAGILYTKPRKSYMDKRLYYLIMGAIIGLGCGFIMALIVIITGIQ